MFELWADSGVLVVVSGKVFLILTLTPEISHSHSSAAVLLSFFFTITNEFDCLTKDNFYTCVLVVIKVEPAKRPAFPVLKIHVTKSLKSRFLVSVHLVSADSVRGVAGCHPMSRPGDRLAYRIPS